MATATDRHKTNAGYLGPGDIYRLVTRASFGDKNAWNPITATAVVLAESTGNPNAVNGNHYGLFQIADTTARGVGRDPSKLFNPDYNANTAFLVYKQAKAHGNGWAPWAQSFQNGRVRANTADARDAAGGKYPATDEAVPEILPGVDDPQVPLLDWAKGLGQLLSNLLSSRFWLRAGMVVGGFALILFGIWLAGKQFVAGTIKKALK
jgi:hypothetical protein